MGGDAQGLSCLQMKPVMKSEIRTTKSEGNPNFEFQRQCGGTRGIRKAVANVASSGRRASCSPSPRPSPSGRGRAIVQLRLNSERPARSRDWRQSILSPRERVGGGGGGRAVSGGVRNGLVGVRALFGRGRVRAE